ncbi:glycoside hydrolase family 3 N-terminal domain-containing protein [Mariniluteicoccus flavus]
MSAAQTPPTPVSALTLAEKVALLSGRDLWTTQPIDHAGVRAIVMTDGPHGVRRQLGTTDHLGLGGSEPATCFPPAVAVGSSWDPAVAERLGRAIGREACALGVDVVLGPGINLKRSPLCGRNFEYYSEDPLLSGALGAAHVTGLAAEGVGASVKHFPANNQETERMRISADVDERTLRELYLPAFEHVVTQARPAMVMAAYNRVNGVKATENRWLLTDVLRDEWAYAGVVVSDWGAVDDPVASLRAGLDLEMPGTRGRSAQAVMAAVEWGALDEEVVDAAVQRVLGLTALTSHTTEEPGDVDLEAHHALARELATECAVLLKNTDRTLPLTPAARVAVIGEFARTPRLRLRDTAQVQPASLYLAYPMLEATMAPATDEVAAVLRTPGLPTDDWIRDAFRNWAGDLALDDPRVSPPHAALEGLPPTYVLTCGIDVLRRSSEPFVERLRRAGVPVWHDLRAGARHAVLDKPGSADGEYAVARLRTWLTEGIDQMVDDA